MKSTTTGFVTKTATAQRRAGDTEKLLEDSATGNALAAVKAAVAELDTNGWHQVGTPTVVSQHVVAQDLRSRPPSLTLAVCLDNSSVRVVDRSGATVPNSTNKSRTWNYYVLARSSLGWRVTDQSFPTDPNC